MTSPPEQVTVQCPGCEMTYQDWFRASINLDLDDFDEAYLDECSSAVCPSCKHKVYFEQLVVRNGIFHFTPLGNEKT